jgi:uncharacterized damage-inducible protein DinB
LRWNMTLMAFIEQMLEESKRRLYRTLRDLTSAELTWQPGPESNPIGFLVWHMARVEDRWLAHFAHDNRTEQQVAAFSMAPLEQVQAYFDAVPRIW